MVIFGIPQNVMAWEQCSSIGYRSTEIKAQFVAKYSRCIRINSTNLYEMAYADASILAVIIQVAVYERGFDVWKRLIDRCLGCAFRGEWGTGWAEVQG